MKTTTITLVSGIILAMGMGICARPAGAQGSDSGRPVELPAPKAPASAATKPQPGDVFKDAKEKASYAMGLNMGASLRAQSVEIDPDLVLRGLKDAMAGGKTLLTIDEARAALMQLQKELQAKAEEKRKVESVSNKSDGEAFLAANKIKEGVVTLPSGLQYQVLTKGAGAKPVVTDTVVCNYRGTLINGTEFDSSYKRGQPTTFPVNGVIKGWTEALQLMPVGSKWRLFVPADLAYADRGAGNIIGAGATLIFEVELLSIEAKK